MKIADVARDIGVHRNTITLLYYEKAKKIDFDVLEKLCKYFNCSVNDLLEYTEKQVRPSPESSITPEQHGGAIMIAEICKNFLS